MPEDSFEEKTEQPTEKRLQEARERGSVAKSTELNSALILLLGGSFLYVTAERMIMQMANVLRTCFLHAGKIEISISNIAPYYMAGLIFLGKVVGPFFLTILIVGIAVNVAQIGFLITSKPLELDLTKLSPVKGISNLVSARGIMETAKSFLKIVIVTVLAYLVIRSDIVKIFATADFSCSQILVFLFKEMYKLGMIISLVLLAMAGIDYAFQRWNYMRQMKMTRQEIKEERKQMEGDPMVKARIKSLQREMARRRMMSEVPKATVVVTNPTFIAIALLYNPDEMNAPKVLAKGKRMIAEKIKKVAAESGVPIVEDKPLARSLYDLVQPGDEIPQQFFSAVAEVLAYVYKLQHKKVA